MALSKYLANELNDMVLRNAAWTPPSSVFVALFTGSGGLDDNAPVAEIVGGSYTRLEVGGATGRSFSISSGKRSDNDEIWVMPTATANWGTITHVAVMSAVSSGNVFYYGALTTAKIVNSGATMRFLAGELDALFT